MRELMRTDHFNPYLPGKGPEFRLEMFDTGRTDHRGCGRVAYRLSQCDVPDSDVDNRLLFDGEDFCGSPLHSIDSDESMRSLLAFLTLRPGDADAEYFENHTPAQIEFCEQHAEALFLLSQWTLTKFD